jgi:UDP-N-acetylglucosamine 2-epimerase (non-hydrolysing)
MITCIIGTRAQLVKMAPVILEIERRGWRLDLVLTGQHRETITEMLEDFAIKTSPQWLYSGAEIKSFVQVVPWFIKCIRSYQRFFPGPIHRKQGHKDVFLVHGDTFSTLLGAMLGRQKRALVAHIEAGLRSFNIFSPFPEELTRLAVFSMTDIAFCPGEWACNNLASYRLETVNTEHNTLLDSLRFVLKRGEGETSGTEDKRFGICSIHRFENVFFKKRLSKIVELIVRAANQRSIRFVLHPVTKKKLSDFALLNTLARHPNVALLDRMKYSDFVQLMKDSAFVITDGGSNQEELFYLQIPTFVVRSVTERQEGLGTTAVLGNDSLEAMHSFLASLPRTRTTPFDTPISPSAIVADRLAEFSL